MGASPRKRKNSLIDINYGEIKKPHLEITSDPQDEIEEKLSESERDNADPINTIKANVPHKLIRLMYKLQLSLLCSFRKFLHDQEYDSLTVEFDDNELDKFHDIVMSNNNRSAHIHIEYLDNQHVDNEINYTKLFAKKERSFSINNYFDSFVRHTICKSNISQKKVRYLIIYTNASLDIAEDMKLRQRRCRIFYPFKFDKLDIEKCYILKDLLFSTDDIAKQQFYKISQEEDTKTELLNRLEFSLAMQKEIKKSQYSEEFLTKLKEKFLSKLVFAVNQPSREELEQIMKNEMSNILESYTDLKEEILNALSRAKKNNLSLIYQFCVLLFTLHDMFTLDKISFVTLKSDYLSNIIKFSYKKKISYIAPYAAKKNINCTQLFPSKLLHDKNMFCVNKYFTAFLKELENGMDIKFFIIYTNGSLDINEDNELKKGRTTEFYPVKFEIIDIQKKRYKVLKNCSFINSNGLYQFAKESTAMLKTLLKFPASIERDKTKSFDESEDEIKEKFIHKLIFATTQRDIQQLNNTIKSNIKETDVSYSYEELHEVALRWSESYDFGPITVKVMRELLDDVKNNRTSHRKIQSEDIIAEIKFAKSVVGTEGSPLFNQFLHFITRGEGKKFIENLSKNGIDLINLSCILQKTGSHGIQAFKNYYNLFFTEKGNATQYLKILEKNKINLAGISSILRGSRIYATSSFEELFFMLFDEKGNKTHYLKSLEREKISMTNITSILSGAGSHAAKTFKELYDLWFDEQGNKTKYLKSLEENKINLVSMSSMLHGSGSNAAKAFKELYDVWFDEDGSKTDYLLTLEKEGIDLANATSILNGAGSNAASSFKNLYNLWFNEKGVKYLENLQENKIDLANMSSIIRGTRTGCSKVFENLYNLWFDKEGKKTRYLKSLEKEGINITTVSMILSGAGLKTSDAFKALFDLWFDENGCKTRYLKNLEKNEISLSTVSAILRGTGCNAAKSYKDLHDLWFDKDGNKTNYLIFFEKHNIHLNSVVSRLLRGAGANCASTFAALHNLWFDEDGNKTKYLKTLDEKGIPLSLLISVTYGAGIYAVKAFKNLHNLWFDEEGNKTQYLEILEMNEIDLDRMCSIVNMANSSAAKAFKNLFDLWFDKDGNKTKYLTVPEENDVSFFVTTRILDSAGSGAAVAYQNLYDLWFDHNGKKTHYLRCLDLNGIKLNVMSSILYRSGTGAAKSYKSLCDLLFDSEGNKTIYAKRFEENDIHLANVSILLGNARNKATNKFLNLYKLWFDEQGRATELLLKSLGKRKRR
ncbi:uncharacterized protein LOC107980470 [Nasonia vitripennis]|uniref:Uncharacterized protein n=1 Tax=Nasonia vitripennis TaxID=7425 RepID=A0A7M7QB08_NASVI|nr:uncharacterized protein LOC107980470 [Nasonia vitripennis]XP_031783852.1 uncharacterized protein LOC107980470 [Nasonia vitripennis]